MSAFSLFPVRGIFRGALVLALAALLATPAHAAEVKIEAKLIWGTNEQKSPNPKHKLVDGALGEKLRKVFAWKNYFEENRQITVIPSRESRKLKMSDKCTIEVTELEGPRAEVKLIGEGKLVNKTTKPLTKGEIVTIGGNDKDGCAWFVIITLLEEK